MPELVAETPVCRECGAEIRSESLFCYNCGQSVEPAETAVVEPIPTEVVENDLNGDEASVETPSSEPSQPPLKSAASLRQKRRAINRKPVEISWEAPTRTPIGFFIATACLTIAVLVLLLLALYLR